jgi:hypothetical protein
MVKNRYNWESPFQDTKVAENTSRPITFLHLKREVDLTDVGRFIYTYKCTNHGSKALNRHIDYTRGHFYKVYSSETIFTRFNSKYVSRILLD